MEISTGLTFQTYWISDLIFNLDQ